MGQTESRRTTLLVIMVVLAIVMVVSVVLIVVKEQMDRGNQGRRLSWCAKNQSQIFGALVAYQIQEETTWPDPRGSMATWKLPAGPITTALDGAKYTAGAFELLAASLSIQHKLFTCPTARWGGPNKKIKASLDESSVLWGWDPTAGVAVSYGFDWASPPDPGSNRVILADRDPQNHQQAVMAVFGDGHSKKLNLMRVVRGLEVMVTESGNTSMLRVGSGVHPDDDIYSNEGDAGEPLTPGKGDPLRAWVK